MAPWGLVVHPLFATAVTTPCLPREGAQSPSPYLTDGKQRASWQVGDLVHIEKSFPTQDPGSRPSGLSSLSPNQAAWTHTLGGEGWPTGNQASVQDTEKPGGPGLQIRSSPAGGPRVRGTTCPGSECSLGHDTGERTSWPGCPLRQASTSLPDLMVTPQDPGLGMLPPLPAVFPKASRSGQISVHSRVTVMGGLGS